MILLYETSWIFVAVLRVGLDQNLLVILLVRFACIHEYELFERDSSGARKATDEVEFVRISQFSRSKVQFDNERRGENPRLTGFPNENRLDAFP